MEQSKEQHPWYGRWLILSGVLLFCFCTIFLLLNLLAQRDLEATQKTYLADKNEFQERFLKDNQEQLALVQALAVHGDSKDAGAFLNTRILWEYAGDAKYFPAQYKHSELVGAKSFSFPPRTLANRSQWWHAPDTAEYHSVDLTWMKKVMAYDHWDLYKTEGLAKYQMEAGVSPLQITLPDYLSLRDLAKLRYWRALHQKGDALMALQEGRQLARLMYSTEWVIGDIVAISLIQIENEFYQEAVRRGLLKAKDWTPIANFKYSTAKAANYATTTWFELLAPTELQTALLDQVILGRCSGLNEAAIMMSHFRYYAGESFIGEPDWSKYLQANKDLLDKHGSSCRATYLKTLLSSTKTPEFNLENEQPSWTRHLFSAVRHIPYLRHYFGMKLYTDYRPHWLGEYSREIANSH